MSPLISRAGVFEFPWGLPLDVDCLGLVEQLRIGEHQVTMALPVLGGDNQSWELAAPTVCGGEPLPSQLANKNWWGSRSSERVCNVTAMAVSFALPPQAATPGSPEFTALWQAFVQWFRIVQEWVAAWTRVPLRDFDTSRDPALHILIKDHHLTGSASRGRTIYIEARPLGQAQLKDAFRRASRDEQVPLAHRMLLYAKDAQTGGDLRKAVIDAATAVEIAVADAIRVHLVREGVPTTSIKKGIDKANGVVKLCKLHERLIGSLPLPWGKLANDLAGVRNSAAHEGRAPNEQEARTARKHAKKIVQVLQPLPEVMSDKASKATTTPCDGTAGS